MTYRLVISLEKLRLYTFVDNLYNINGNETQKIRLAYKQTLWSIATNIQIAFDVCSPATQQRGGSWVSCPG